MKSTDLTSGAAQEAAPDPAPNQAGPPAPPAAAPLPAPPETQADPPPRWMKALVAVAGIAGVALAGLGLTKRPGPLPRGTPLVHEGENIEQLRQITAHPWGIWQLAFSADGSRILAACEDYSVRSFDVETGQLVHVMQGPRTWAIVLGFSDDGSKVLVSAAREGSKTAKDSDVVAEVWDVATGRRERRFDANAGRVMAVAITTDARRLVTGHWDGTVHLWDADAGRELAKFEQLGPVTHLVISPDGARAYSGNFGGTVFSWNLQTRKPLGRWAAHKNNAIVLLKLSPDGRRLLTGGWDATLKLWEQDEQDANPTGFRLASAQKTAATEVGEFSADGRRLITGGWWGTLALWDATTLDPIGSLKGFGGMFPKVAISPDAKYAATAGPLEWVWVWKLPD